MDFSFYDQPYILDIFAWRTVHQSLCGDYLNLSTVPSPLEFFFQEQSYSSLHSGRSLAWDQVRGDIDDPCCAIADFCGVIADFCGVIADPCGPAALSRSLRRSATPIVARLAKHHKTLLNMVKHHETHVKHCETLKTL